jgi:hypothetical protein
MNTHHAAASLDDVEAEKPGSLIMVALKVKMKRTASDIALVEAINEMEERMQRRFTSPQLKYSFFEPDKG